MRAVYSSNLPFDIHNSTTHPTLYDFSSGFIYKYQYIESGNVTSALICRYDSPRTQVAYLVVISACEIRKHAVMETIAINNTWALSDECLRMTYSFIIAEKRVFLNNRDFKYHFIYKDTGHINTDHFVSVYYDDCHTECQDNYKYAVFVRHIDDKTIIKHTAHVGQVIFTGYYHKGFWLSIFSPEEVCLKQLECILALYH